ncbi:hypothetical protein [Brucella sp. IR073]|uniref:hypothetical protein n=1 Tax=unclassified Brucella TaxID=2632610 RepID=UPI003B981837
MEIFSASPKTILAKREVGNWAPTAKQPVIPVLVTGIHASTAMLPQRGRIRNRFHQKVKCSEGRRLEKNHRETAKAVHPRGEHGLAKLRMALSRKRCGSERFSSGTQYLIRSGDGVASVLSSFLAPHRYRQVSKSLSKSESADFLVNFTVAAAAGSD